jgi:hypothetical protein
MKEFDASPRVRTAGNLLQIKGSRIEDRGSPVSGTTFASISHELFNLRVSGAQMRHILTLSAAFLLAGCAIPPALTIASLAVDGVSYLSTGKSTTDHALSAVASEDCALMRVLQEKAICTSDETLVGMVDTPATGDEELPQSEFRDQDN